MVLVQKKPFFELFFLGNIGQEKHLLRYSRTKKLLPWLQKQDVENVEKLTFFQRRLPISLVQK